MPCQVVSALSSGLVSLELETLDGGVEGSAFGTPEDCGFTAVREIDEQGHARAA